MRGGCGRRPSGISCSSCQPLPRTGNDCLLPAPPPGRDTPGTALAFLEGMPGKGRHPLVSRSFPGAGSSPTSKKEAPVKRISNLFLCLVLAVGAAAYAQETMNKTVSGRVISSSAFDLAIQTDAGTRLNLVLDSATTKPAVLAVGDQVTVVYHALDTGGFQAVQVIEGTQGTEPAKPAGTTTRTLTNTGTPGTNGQTGESRTTVVGTTGGYQAP